MSTERSGVRFLVAWALSCPPLLKRLPNSWLNPADELDWLVALYGWIDGLIYDADERR